MAKVLQIINATAVFLALISTIVALVSPGWLTIFFMGSDLGLQFGWYEAHVGLITTRFTVIDEGLQFLTVIRFNPANFIVISATVLIVVAALWQIVGLFMIMKSIAYLHEDTIQEKLTMHQAGIFLFISGFSYLFGLIFFTLPYVILMVSPSTASLTNKHLFATFTDDVSNIAFNYSFYLAWSALVLTMASSILSLVISKRIVKGQLSIRYDVI